MRGIQDLPIDDKRVLVRCGLNVPLDERGSIVDDFRLRESIPTIQYLHEKKAKTILMAHLGRPTDEKNVSRRKKMYTLAPVADRLRELLGYPVPLLGDCIGKNIERETRNMNAGDVVLLENLRFYEGEKENDPQFAKSLSELGDVYINDAFAVSHRAHASIVGVPQHLPSAMGFLVEKEITALSKVIKNPPRPLVAIVGGTKIATKADFLDEISAIADTVLVGNPVFAEISEKRLSFRGSEKIVGPIDGIPSQKNALDIGPQTVSLFEEKVRNAQTVLWTGPLGKIEEEPYDQGSLKVAQAIIKSGAYSVAGGGDLNGFLHTHDLDGNFNHTSTGGGAMLAFLSGETLPGLAALE